MAAKISLMSLYYNSLPYELCFSPVFLQLGLAQLNQASWKYFLGTTSCTFLVVPSSSFENIYIYIYGSHWQLCSLFPSFSQWVSCSWHSFWNCTQEGVSKFRKTLKNWERTLTSLHARSLSWKSFSFSSVDIFHCLLAVLNAAKKFL